jgi:hypothetical protein
VFVVLVNHTLVFFFSGIAVYEQECNCNDPGVWQQAHRQDVFE